MAGSVGAPGPAGGDALLEREAVLRALGELRAALASGDGGALAVVGAAGLGKSRLLDLAAADAARDGARVLRVRGDELERSFAWGGVLGLLGATSGAPDLPPAAAPGLALLRGERPDLPADREQRAFALLHALAAVVAGLARRRPLLLVLDDAQWLDAPTLRLVRYLLGRLDGLGVALLVALRPGEGGDGEELLASILAHPRTREERLAPLTPAGVATFVRSTVAAAADDRFCGRCAELTGGNPFYLQELAVALGPDAAPALEALRDLTPRTVARSVLARVRPLGAGPAAVLRALAVLGDGVPAAWVAELAGLPLDEVLAHADLLAAADLVDAGPVLRFTHQLVRASVAAEEPAGRASADHARAARLVQARGAPPEQVAAHLLLAPAGAVPGAVATLRRAAARASGRAAPASAVAYLERALAEPADREARLELRAELGAAAVAAGSHRAVEHLGALVEEVEPGRPRAEALLAQGWALHGAGHPGPAADAFAAGSRELAGAPGGAVDAELATELRVGELTAGMLDAGRAAWAQEELARFPQGPATGTAAGRHLRSQLLVAGLFSGAVPASTLAGDALELAHEAAAQPDRFTSWTLWNAVGTLSWCDRYADVLPLVEGIRSRAQDSGSLLTLAMAAYARAWPALWTGRLVEATDDARQAVAIWSTGAQGYLPAAAYWLVTGALELGRDAEAEEALAAVEEERWRETAFFAFTLAARARLAAARGDAEAALAAWTACGEHVVTRMQAHNPTLLPWRAEAAELAVRTGDRTLALRLARDDVERATRFGAGRALGEARRGLGLATGGEAGLALLEQAVDTLAPSGAELPLARAVVDLGGALRRAGRPRQARTRLAAGLARAEALGAVALADRAAEELRVAGGRPRRRLDAGEGPRSLTSSELRVALLAAEGLTNRQIAQRLFVTVKAVEWHLSRSYAKLGIGGRTALWVALELGGLGGGDLPG